MKQSTKLLSLVLALIMAFSCMSVIGNAALSKSDVTWDCIDDAALTAEQVADLALDLVDNDLLAGMETIDLSILGQLRLNKVDYILADVVKLRASAVWTIGSGLIGDIGDFNFDPLKKSGSWGWLGIGATAVAYSRNDGDLTVIGQLLSLLGSNADIVSKIAYGLGTSDGISLGLISSFLDLGDIGDLLGDIPHLLKTLVYDMLIFGSYGFDSDAEELGNVLPTSVDTLDEMINQAVVGLLVNPQDYTWEGEGDAAVKVWDEDSLILPTVAGYGFDTVKDYFNLNGSSNDYDGDGVNDKNSLFQIIDKIAPFAIYDLGINALNHNLKKSLMKAVDIDFAEVDVTSLPSNVKTDFEVDAEDGKETYCNYIAYDRMCKSGSTWYYTTLENETLVDDNDEPILDAEGNEQTHKVRKFFKANMAGANDFASLINWDWDLYAPVPLTGDTTVDDINELNYEAFIAEYGSITEMLNHIIYVVYENALTDDVKESFTDLTGDGWVDGPTSENIMYNLERLGKYLLSEHADKMFGSDSPYVDWEYDDVADKTITELVAIIGPTFFEDVMPQLVMPKDADGMYAFHSGVELLEFGALVIREFITEIAPSVNYDAYIFAEGTVTSANDRQFADLQPEEWKNLILNMGMDIACTYLMNITNFEDYCKKVYGSGFDLQGYISAGGGTDEGHWTAILDTAIMWAVNYVSDGTNSVLKGFEPSAVSAHEGPLNKLSYILNTLLPLGFVNGCTSSSYDFDVSLLLDKIVALLTDFDLAQVASLFGRNQDSSYNAFDDGNLLTVVLDLVNDILALVFGSRILQGVTNDPSDGSIASLDNVVSKANLKTTIKTLLTSLYTVGTGGLLTSALPVVGKLIKGWGTEQFFNPPQIDLSRSVSLTNGATPSAVTVNVRNASDGVWRHYKDEAGNEYTDEQYKIVLKSVAVNDEMGESGSSQYVTVSCTEQTIDYGKSGSFTYTAANVPTTGALVRFKVGYQVLDESGSPMVNGKIFYTESYAWLNYNGSNERQETHYDNDGSLSYAKIWSPFYVPLSTAIDYITEIAGGEYGREKKTLTFGQEAGITNNSGTQDGLTLGFPGTRNFSNDNLYFRNIQPFKSYTLAGVDGDGNDTSTTVNITGAINEAAWKAANKTSGSKTSWSVSLTAKGKTQGATFELRYYDDIYQSKLASLSANEMDALRLASDYNLSGTVYANGILTSANSTDEEGETIFRESNFNTLVWIDDDKTEYAASQVTDIVETTDDNGNVVSATGKVGDVSVKKVTKIDCATAINNYVAAFVPGIRGGQQVFNDNTVYNFKELYEPFYVASNDIQYCKKTTEQIVAEGNADNIDGAVSTLKADLAASEAAYSDNYDYTDYKMYRWNRYNDARDDANYFINLQNDASNATVAEIDEVFPYTWIEEDDLRALVKGDKYEANILALLEKLEGEELKAKEEWLANKKLEYQSQTLLDVEMASGYLAKMGPRLLKRGHGVQTKYLADEITSAENMIGTTNGAKGVTYTQRSWDKYIAAYNDAKTVLANPTQMTVFDAKWELLCCRNELVKVGEEADYSELVTLIAQAEQALANQNLYDNTAKDFGMVLAELGYHDFTNANGDTVQLFPGSAIYTNTEPYTTEDQDIIDDAAEDLKEALGRLNFKGVSVTYKNVEVSTGTLVEGDEEAGIEAVTTRISRIDSEKSVDAIKALFAATGSGFSVAQDDITITNDLYYSLEVKGQDPEEMVFVGTNATVTFYTASALDGVMIPVATVKLIVDGDINGDGAVDVLDAAYATLVSHDKGALEGCYLLAGDLDAATDREIKEGDVSAIVNIALGK